MRKYPSAGAHIDDTEIEGNRAFDPRDLDLDLDLGLGGSPAALVRLDSCGRVGH